MYSILLSVGKIFERSRKKRFEVLEKTHGKSRIFISFILVDTLAMNFLSIANFPSQTIRVVERKSGAAGKNFSSPKKKSSKIFDKQKKK